MRGSRKMEHISHALQLGQSRQQGLSDIRFVHNSLPETSMDNISLHTTIGELSLSSPIVINAMTGGAPDTEEINRNLAIAAREKNLAMAVGSQMAAIKNADAASSYRIVRRENPNGTIFANLGGEATFEQAQRAIEMIGADALQIHLNTMQELIMPEGDRSFHGTLKRIETIVRHVQVPVIVKEVGFGIMGGSARKLRDIGVSCVDVGGFGGTNFAKIENARRQAPVEWLDDWGCKTSVAIIEVLQVFPQGSVIASGGITNSLEIAKSLSLGASAVGMAGMFLRLLKTEGIQALIQYIEEMENDLRLVMTALGANTIDKLWDASVVITGETAEWSRARGIDITHYARRGLF